VFALVQRPALRPAGLDAVGQGSALTVSGWWAAKVAGEWSPALHLSRGEDTGIRQRPEGPVTEPLSSRERPELPVASPDGRLGEGNRVGCRGVGLPGRTSPEGGQQVLGDLKERRSGQPLGQVEVRYPIQALVPEAKTPAPLGARCSRSRRRSREAVTDHRGVHDDLEVVRRPDAVNSGRTLPPPLLPGADRSSTTPGQEPVRGLSHDHVGLHRIALVVVANDDAFRLFGSAGLFQSTVTSAFVDAGQRSDVDL